MRQRKEGFLGNVNEDAVPVIYLPIVSQWRSVDDEHYEDIRMSTLKAYLSQGWVFANPMNHSLKTSDGKTLLVWELEYRPQKSNTIEIEIDVLDGIPNPRIPLTDEDMAEIQVILKSLNTELTMTASDRRNTHGYRGFKVKDNNQVISVFGNRVFSVNPVGIWNDNELRLETFLAKKVYKELDESLWKAIMSQLPCRTKLEKNDESPAEQPVQSAQDQEVASDSRPMEKAGGNSGAEVGADPHPEVPTEQAEQPHEQGGEA